MQYFRNTSRRMMNCPNPRDGGMLPLCRNDAERQTNGMRENPNRCGCSQNERNTENERNERTSGCCEAGLRNAETNRADRREICGCAENTRNDRADGYGCANNTRNDRTDGCGCANNTRNDRTDGCDRTNHSRNDRMGDCMNTRADRANKCGCGEHDHAWRCDNTPTAESYGCTGLAMAFVPEQEFCDLNDAEEALCRGTLFRQLDMPFYGQRRRNCK